jgi:hypothetical protein
VRRVYTDVANFRAPYDGGSLTLTGLGRTWPAGRSYQDVSNYRAPYDSGYFQSNSLFGLGAVQMSEEKLRLMPVKVQRYLRSGEPVGTMRRDLGAASAQIPRLVWGASAVGASVLAYYSWKKYKRSRRYQELTANRRRR